MSNLSSKSAARLFQSFHSLYTAGVPLQKILVKITTRERDKNILKIMDILHNRINEGKSLGEAFKDTKLVDEYACLIIEQGMATGRLDEALLLLTNFYTRKYQFRMRLIKKLFYPLVILPFAIIFILPLPKLVHSGASAYVQEIIPSLFVIGLVLVSIKFIKILMKSFPSLANVLSSIFIFFPVWGGFYRKILAMRFIEAFVSLVTSGVPLHESLRISGNSTHSALYISSLNAISKKVAQGHELAHSFQTISLFPIELKDAMEIAEESGDYEKPLLKTKTLLESEVEATIGAFEKLLPVIVLIFFSIFLFFKLSNFLSSYTEMIDKIGIETK